MRPAADAEDPRLHQHPDVAARLAEDDAWLQAFVLEVRRFYPFFPAVAGVARESFAWREF